MANLTRLTRLLNGVNRGVAISENTLVVDNLKIKMGSGNDANHATWAGTLTAARTITMPDTNVDLGDIAANTSDIADIRTTQGTSDGDTDLGTFTGTTIPDSSTVKGALQSLETAHETTDGLIDGHLDGSASKHDATEIDYERSDGSKKNIQAASDDAEAALTDLDDAIGALAASPTNYTPANAAITADHLSGIDSALGTLTSTINNFEWKNSALDYVVDNTAAPASEVTGDRYILSHDGGAPHANYDGASAGDIVEFNGTTWDAVTPTAGTFIAADDESNGLYLWGGSSWAFKAFESTTASGLLTKSGFDIQMASGTAGNFIVYNSGGTATSVAMSSEASMSDTGAVTLSNAAVIAKVLTGFTSGAGTVTATDSILQAIQKLDGNHAAHLADASDAHDASAISYDNSSSGLTATDAQAAIDEVEGRVDALEAQGGNESVIESFDAGETLTAGVRALRMRKAADAGGTDGRVHLADKDASSADDFWVVGLVVATGETAGTSVSVTKAGKLTATAHGLTVGEPFFLGASGALTSTAPSAADEAVAPLGIARDANTLEVAIKTPQVN